jgi:hypothetical protein
MDEQMIEPEIKADPSKVIDGGESMKLYIEKSQEIEKENQLLMKEKAETIDEMYEKLKAKGNMQCSDHPSKEAKIGRILTLKTFPGKFTYRDAKIDDDFVKTTSDDWEYSSKTRHEIFRDVCMNPKNNDVLLSTDRSEGTATSVAPDWKLCDKSFPGKDYMTIGGMHTHPDFLDKPLESLGDVIVFASSDNEMYSCTVTKWGLTCLYRVKEPAKIFDIPRLKKGGDTKNPEPEIDADGKIIHDVKSDVVDWSRTMKFATRNTTDAIFAVARGKMTRGLTEALLRVPLFKPIGIDQSVGTVSAMSKFGKEKSEPRIVENMTCESFIDVIGINTKIRTVCNDSGGKTPFYVESPVTPGRLFFYKNKGFPTNFYFDSDVNVQKEFPLKKDQSKFWDRVEKNRNGYYKTRTEMADEIRGVETPRKTVRAGKFSLDGKYQCEYLLLPLPEGKEDSGIGKPAGVLCQKAPKIATEKICILT